MTEYYERHFRRLDWIVPLVISVLIFVVLRFHFGDAAVMEAAKGDRAALYGAIAAVGGSLLGFAIALIPLTQGLIWLPGLELTRSSRHAKSLFDTFLDSVIALGLLTLASLVALLFDRETAPHVEFQYGVGLLAIVAIWKLGRAVHLMWLVLMVALVSVQQGDRNDR